VAFNPMTSPPKGAFRLQEAPTEVTPPLEDNKDLANDDSEKHIQEEVKTVKQKKK
jgi:hypothetical protein